MQFKPGLTSVRMIGRRLRVRSLRKSKIGFLNPKESENRFCVSLPTKQIDPRSFGSCPENFRVDSSVPLAHHEQRDLRLICLVKKRKIRFRVLSDLKIQSLVFYFKETDP